MKGGLKLYKLLHKIIPWSIIDSKLLTGVKRRYIIEVIGRPITLTNLLDFVEKGLNKENINIEFLTAIETSTYIYFSFKGNKYERFVRLDKSDYVFIVCDRYEDIILTECPHKLMSILIGNFGEQYSIADKKSQNSQIDKIHTL